MDSLASIYHAAGQYGQAIKLYEETLPLMKDKLGPNHPVTLETMHDLARTYSALGRHAEELKLREETLELRKTKLGVDHPDTLESMHMLARLLANSSDPKVRNARRAVELAKQAIDLAPKVGHFWNALGVAYYRAEDWKASVQTLEKSMQLCKGGDSFDWFFLAMAHWQLGHMDEARKWHDQAVEWMDKNQPDNEGLRRFRAEAAQVIGMKEKE
jgi:tetratricopeptide (TPR) repeat protein